MLYIYTHMVMKTRYPKKTGVAELEVRRNSSRILQGFPDGALEGPLKGYLKEPIEEPL